MSTAPQRLNQGSKTRPPLPRLPPWLKIRPPEGERYRLVRELVGGLRLPTVCEEARCPNLSECWSGGTATFMLLGEVCTRGCSFCSVKTARRGVELDVEEPAKIVDAVTKMGLSYVVLTSVDRDDLPDGGAAHFAATVRALKDSVPGLLVETLTPDFQGNVESIAVLAASGADVLAHNVETVARLSPEVRDPRADYAQSLEVLRQFRILGERTGSRSGAASRLLTKSSLMLGLGETDEELDEAFADLRAVGVELLTLGQYLRPTRSHRKVHEFVPPERFESLAERARAHGFLHVASGPFVRSSYKAGEAFVESLLRGAAS